MTENAVLDELDLLLITALQASPRADWQSIGRVLRVSASTVARRWARLSDSGMAWLSCHPLRLPNASPIVAIIEIDCLPGRLHAIAADVANDSHVFTVAHLAGSRDLLIVAAFVDHVSLARYAGFRLGGMEGVTAVRTELATVHVEGSRWRLERLDENHRGSVEAARPAADLRDGPDATDLAIMTALGEDCRIPAVELAKRVDLSPSTALRRLARLEATRALVYRCDVARSLSGWPVSVGLWAVVRPELLNDTVRRLAEIREIRMCASISGPHNLHMAVWLRSADDLPALEARIVKRIPALTFVDRAVSLWSIKRGGHLLDPYGRRIRSIPISPWPDEKYAVEAETALLTRLTGDLQGITGRSTPARPHPA